MAELFAGVEMIAGRELDQLIAERVMRGVWLYPSDACPMECSTDMRAAFALLHHVAECGWLYTITGERPLITVRLQAFEGMQAVVGRANTLPLAICIAALKTMEVKRA